jgi:hypothetical protein
MGTRGGKQPGAGRPVGSINKKTQELILKATQEGISPIEVLLNDMRFFYNLGEDKMLQAQQTEDGKKQANHFRAACSLKEIARGCARDAAPYIHPKLASLQANVNIHNVEAELAELE